MAADAALMPTLLDAPHPRRAVAALDLEEEAAHHPAADHGLWIVHVEVRAAVVDDLPHGPVGELDALAGSPALEVARDRALHRGRRLDRRRAALVAERLRGGLLLRGSRGRNGRGGRGHR